MPENGLECFGIGGSHPGREGWDDEDFVADLRGVAAVAADYACDSGSDLLG